ncbi:MAG: diphthine--ammonia ligase [Sedimentisphaerales bacterium]|nr:diphthine--ammonia ligase [Sedimentisphaerales bacterium]
MSHIASWSGGKDSCLACYKAMLGGYDIRYLVNFVSKEYGRVSFHGTETGLIRLQAESIGKRLCQKQTSGDCYEQQFKEAVRSLIPDGIKGMIFGDIYLQEHKDWAERVCAEMGIEAVEPLWGRDTEDILSDFIDAGFQAVIIGAKSGLIDAEWLGRRVDRDFIEYLKRRNICPCGENGEYHTLVIDGPIFNRGIEIVEARTIARDDFWFLDTCKYELV